MKKFLLSIIALVMGVVNVSAQDLDTIPDYSLYINDVTVAAGDTCKIVFGMKNSEVKVQAIGVKYTMPDGFTINTVVDEFGDEGYDAGFVGRTSATRHDFGTNQVGDEYRVAIISSKGLFITGTEGDLFYTSFTVDPSVEPGTYHVNMYEGELSGKEGIINNYITYTSNIYVTAATGVQAVQAESSGEVEIYDINGMKLSQIKEGINIIKDVQTGAVKKVIK